MNEILFVVTILANFTAILCAYKFFGKTGLYAWIAAATIIANIEVLKCVDIFSMALTLGNVTYGTIFLATDILNEKYGTKAARKGVFIGFFTLSIFVILSQTDLLYIPNAADFAHPAMQTLFSIIPGMCFASMFAYFCSNLLDVSLYALIRKHFPSDGFLWMRNNGATIISQFFDTVLFTCIAFCGIFTRDVLFELILTTFIIKIIIAVSDTPFLYISKKIKPGDD